MNEYELQNYMRSNIPLTITMGITVQRASADCVILGAPLAPNVNDKDTAFGGSLHAIATLSCWSLAFINLKQIDQPIDIVIFGSEIKYLAPVTRDFTVESRAINDNDFHHFEKTFLTKGKARIRLNAQIYQGDKLAVDYWGEFVALKGKEKAE